MQFNSEAITDYALELSFSQLSDDAVTAAKRLTLDSIGCCLGAYPSPPSKHLRTIYGSSGDVNDATVFGSGNKTLVEYAGLINSTMVRYLDYNDTYINEGRACHPSDHIPALISVAEVEDCTGKDLIEAITIAYEIEGLGLDTGVAWEYDYDYVTWGSYSSVAAVGKLMNLSQEQMKFALGIAGSSNLSLSISRKGDVSMWKGVAHPYVTHNAIQACQMAQAGLTGPKHVFEGPGGFFEVAAKREIEINQLGGRNGAAYRITKSHIKPFPCGYYMQPIITGVRDLIDEHELDPEEIEAIDIETFEQAATILGGEEKWSKDLTRESADHSIPYTAAIAAIYGDVNPEHYNEKYRTQAEVHHLMDLVSVEESDEMNTAARRNPDSTPSYIRLATDEETYEKRVDYAPGHAKNPLSEAEIEAKMTNMTSSLLTDDQIDMIVRFCNKLDQQHQIEPLLTAIVV